MDRAQVWAIFWGDLSQRSDHPEALRISFDKCRDPQQAARKCFGFVADNMHAKPLGASITYLRVHKNFVAEMAKENWRPCK